MRYEKLLAIVGVMAVISLNAGITFLFGMLIVGIPLFFATTAFVYLLAMYPAVRVKRSGQPHWVIGLVLVSGLAAVAFVVPLLAHARFALAEYAIQTDDYKTPFQLVGETVELVLKERSYHPTQPAVSEAPCELACQSLLRLQRINTVYVTNNATSVAYTMDDKDCVLEPISRNGLTTRHRWTHCYSSKTVSAVPTAALTVTASTPRGMLAETQNWTFKPWWLKRVVRVEITANSVPAARMSYIEGEVASAPLYFDYSFEGGVARDSRMHRERFPSWQMRTFELLKQLMN